MLLILLTLPLLWFSDALVVAQQCRLVLAGGALTNSTPAPTSAGRSATTSIGASSTATGASSATPTPTVFNYGTTPIRGVNLGGWFVLEPWITPTLFESFNNSDIIDEYTLGNYMDQNEGLRLLKEHWETWITEDDLKAIKAAGLNHVRMQIGYWSVPMTSADTNYTTSVSPYIPGAWPYLIQALNWAKENGLHVILDLHGAPHSQNGYDNSGQRGSANWASNSDDVPRTLDIIKVIVEKLGGMIDVLELLNEPLGSQPAINSVIGDYWKEGYNVVRTAAGQGIKVMIMDAFLTVEGWRNFMTYPSYQGVIMDTHEYQVFNWNQIELSWDGHIDYSCKVMSQLKSYAQSNIYTVIGEWTTAVTDCAKWLNGRGVGARWDGTWQPGYQTFGSCDGMTGSMNTFSDEYKTFMRKYYEAQVTIGENIQGWVYWTWKTDGADDWSYQRGLQGGWIPQDPTDRLYPNICSGY